MAYPFVAAKYDYGPRKGPALALVIHMAEGGNTVSYLHNSPARGVSVHFVVQYSGIVVQMLNLNRTSGSINPATLRTNEGPAPYGYSTAKQVMGSWWPDPNSAVISVEVEGFASTGPNAQQTAALNLWAADMRTKLPQLTGALGHRDFQNVKACPGAHIDWNGIGGHGLWHGSGPIGDTVTTVTQQPYPSRAFSSKSGVSPLRRFSATEELSGIATPYSASVDADVGIDGTGPHGPLGSFLRLASGGSAGNYILATEVDVTMPAPVPDPVYEPVTEQLYRKA